MELWLCAEPLWLYHSFPVRLATNMSLVTQVTPPNIDDSFESKECCRFASCYLPPLELEPHPHDFVVNGVRVHLTSYNTTFTHKSQYLFMVSACACAACACACDVSAPLLPLVICHLSSVVI